MRFSFRFGWKTRGVFAVTCVPIPPFFFALPLRGIGVPMTGLAPVISQSRDMMFSLFDQQHVAGALDLLRELAVHLGGHASDAAGQNAALLRQEFLEQFGILEIDCFHVDVDASL